MDGLLPVAGKELLSQGILGILVFVLIWYIGQLRKEHKDEVRDLKAEIAAKDKRIEQLADDRLTDAKQFVEIAQGLRTQGQAFLSAIERKT